MSSPDQTATADQTASPATSPTPGKTRSDRALVDERIALTLAELARGGVPASPHIAELTEPVARLAALGKRTRSLLAIEAHAAAGGSNTDGAIWIAAALELFQVAALIHDDILDNADTRRGLPAVHSALTSLHSTSGWLGDSQAFGTGAAILAGDYALMGASLALGQAVAPAGAIIGATVASQFSSMAAVCTAGQYLDVRLAAQPWEDLGAQREAILDMMAAKTASYSTTGPLVLGAALAGADAQSLELWREVGAPWGIAFQLRDDVMGVFGDPATTGKPAGDDLREGKRTVLLAIAFSLADAAQRQAILAVVEGNGAGEAEIAAAIAAVEATGALAAVEQLIEEQAALAKAAISSLGVGSVHAASLAALVDSTVHRVS